MIIICVSSEVKSAEKWVVSVVMVEISSRVLSCYAASWFWENLDHDDDSDYN